MSSHNYQPGMRVAAILKADKTTVYLLGYGTYDGDFERPEDMGITPDEARELLVGEDVVEDIDGEALDLVVAAFNKNPRITLDSGDIVWGCECWWGPEHDLREAWERLGQQVVMVTLDREPQRG